MTRTIQIGKGKQITPVSLKTITDEEGVIWVQTYPGNWIKHSSWEEETNQKKETLRNVFISKKRKELQSIAKSRGIPGNGTNQMIVNLLIDFNVPSV